MVREIKKTKAVDLKNMTLRELFEQEVIRTGGSNRFKLHAKLLDMEEVVAKEISDTPFSLLDLTPNQILENKGLVEDILMDENSAYKKYEANRRLKKPNVRPQLSQTVATLDQIIGRVSGEKSVFKKHFETTVEDYKVSAGAGTNPGQRNYKLGADFYERVGDEIAIMPKGANKNITSLLFLGGFRPDDVAKFRIEDINFSTGAIETRTKTGAVYGVLSEPILDIIKQQLDETGKTINDKGHIFKDQIRMVSKTDKKTKAKYSVAEFKPAVETEINNDLKNAGKVEYRSDDEIDFKSKDITMKELRHSTEHVYNTAGHAELDRELATLRVSSKKAKTTGEGYRQATPSIKKAREIQRQMIATKSAYLGAENVHVAMKKLGVKKLSDTTKKIVVNISDLEDEFYFNHLQETNPELLSRIKKNPIVEGNISNTQQKLSKEFTKYEDARFKLLTERNLADADKIKKERLKSEKETFKLEQDNEEIRIEKEKIRLEKLAKRKADNIKKVLEDSQDSKLSNSVSDISNKENLDLSDRKSVSKLFDSLLGKDKTQKFMSDAIQGTKTFLSGIQEGAMENYDDQVKAMEANRGKPPLEKFMLGAGEAIGMSGRLIGKAARFVKPNIRDVAEREASDITGATAKITNEADQLEMQKQMAAIEDNMANVPEGDVVPETTEEKTQKELSELGF